MILFNKLRILGMAKVYKIFTRLLERLPDDLTDQVGRLDLDLYEEQIFGLIRSA